MAKRSSVMATRRWCEDQLKLAHRYLGTDEGSDLRIFRPLFDNKRDASGDALPPHKDWVKHLFIRRREKAIVRLHKLLRRIGDMKHSAARVVAQPTFIDAVHAIAPNKGMVIVIAPLTLLQSGATRRLAR